MGRPSSRRTIVTSDVSRIGTASTMMGSKSVATVQTEVVRQEADAGKADSEREGRNQIARVHGEGVDCKEGARNGGERGCEPIHVVEKIEGVRHPDEPEDADQRCEHRIAD